MNENQIVNELAEVASLLTASKKTAAVKDLSDIKGLLEDMHKKQAEFEKKREEYLRETNKMWNDATKNVNEGIEALLADIQKELVLYFKGNGMGIRKASGSGGLVEVFIGSDDITDPDVAGRYQSKVSAMIHLQFEGRESATASFANENRENWVTFDLKDKNTVDALMQEVKKADKKGFWKPDEPSDLGTLTWTGKKMVRSDKK